MRRAGVIVSLAAAFGVVGAGVTQARAGRRSAVALPALRVGLEQRGTPRAHATAVPLSGCVIQPGANVQEGLPIPTSVTFQVAIDCPRGSAVRAARTWIINSRQTRVSSRAFCAAKAGVLCVAQGSYTPRLGSYTRVLALRGRAVMVSKVRGGIWVPLTTKRTLEHCVGFFTPTLYCGWTDRFITPDHRCDLTPISAPVTPMPPTFRLYPSEQRPLAPFIDGKGRKSRLYWGTTQYVGPAGGVFWSGFGYQHIAPKHGWGPLDEQATRIAIHGRPVSTQKRSVGPKGKKVVRIRRIYEGPRYAQNAATCLRVVVIDYPPGSSTGGNIVTSYGAVVGEPWSSPVGAQG